MSVLPELTYLYAVHQRLIGQVAVDEGHASSYSLQGKPEYQILRAVSTIDCNQLSCSNPEVIHEPIAHSLQVGEELLVCPCPALEHKE
jgi:hypothetical protein